MIHELFAGKQSVSFTYIMMNRGGKNDQVVNNYLRIIKMSVICTYKHPEMSLWFEDDREYLPDGINLSIE